MKAHPIIDYPFRWIPMLVAALVLVVIQVALVCGYTGTGYLPALVDGIATIGWLAVIAYLAWYVVGLVSLFQTDVIMIVAGNLLWLAGSFMVCDIMVRIVGLSYIPFAPTVPFRLLFGFAGFDCGYALVSSDSCQRRVDESGTGEKTHRASSY